MYHIHFNFLTVCACVLSCFNCVQFFATLWTVTCQDPLSMGIFQARILEWVDMPSSMGSFWPRHQTHVSYISCIGIQVLYHWYHLGIPFLEYIKYKLNFFSDLLLCSVTKSYLTLCDPMNCSTPGFPVLHYLPKLLKLMSIDSVMLCKHLTLCHPCLLLPSIFPSIRIFYNRSKWPTNLHIGWPKDWSFSFSISPSNKYSGMISFTIDLFDLLAVQRTSQESSLVPQFKSMSYLTLSLLYGPTLTSVHDYWKNHSLDYMDLCQLKWCLCFLLCCLCFP